MVFFRRNISSVLIITILFLLNVCFAYSQDSVNKSPGSKLRIQIKVFSLDDFSNASNFAKEISAEHKMNSRVLETEGWFKIVLGDFVDYDRAEKKLSEIVASYPEAWIKNVEKNNIKISYKYLSSEHENKDMVKDVFHDSVINVIPDTLNSSNKGNGKSLFGDHIARNILIFIAIILIIIISIIINIRIKANREKNKIKKEEEDNQKFWEKLMEDEN